MKKMSEITSGICKINADQVRQVHSTAVQEAEKIKCKTHSFSYHANNLIVLNQDYLKTLEQKLTLSTSNLIESSEQQKDLFLGIVDEVSTVTSALSNSLSSSINYTKDEIQALSNEVRSF